MRSANPHFSIFCFSASIRFLRLRKFNSIKAEGTPRAHHSGGIAQFYGSHPFRMPQRHILKYGLSNILKVSREFYAFNLNFRVVKIPFCLSWQIRLIFMSPIAHRIAIRTQRDETRSWTFDSPNDKCGTHSLLVCCYVYVCLCVCVCVSVAEFKMSTFNTRV